MILKYNYGVLLLDLYLEEIVRKSAPRENTAAVSCSRVRNGFSPWSTSTSPPSPRVRVLREGFHTGGKKVCFYHREICRKYDHQSIMQCILLRRRKRIKSPKTSITAEHLQKNYRTVCGGIKSGLIEFAIVLFYYQCFVAKLTFYLLEH